MQRKFPDADDAEPPALSRRVGRPSREGAAANANGPTGDSLGWPWRVGGWLLAALTALAGAVYVETARRADPDTETDGRIFAQDAAIDLHSPVWSLAYSPDGALLVIAQADGGATLWGLAEGRKLARVRANGCALQCVAFSADGRSLATGGSDGRVRLWDVARAVGSRTPALRLIGPREPHRRAPAPAAHPPASAAASPQVASPADTLPRASPPA
jgi:hypothetical protein